MTRNKETFEELLHKLKYKSLSEFEKELGFRIRFEGVFKYQDFSMATVIKIYEQLKARWWQLYYETMDAEELDKFLNTTEHITLTNLAKSLGYKF